MFLEKKKSRMGKFVYLVEYHPVNIYSLILPTTVRREKYATIICLFVNDIVKYLCIKW